MPSDAGTSRARQRDAAGHGRLRVRLFGNVSTETVTGVGMAARTTTTSWGTTGQFPVTVTNALNQTTTQGVEHGARTAGFGRPTRMASTGQLDLRRVRPSHGRDASRPDLDRLDLLGLQRQLRSPHQAAGAAERSATRRTRRSAVSTIFWIAGIALIWQRRSCSRPMTRSTLCGGSTTQRGRVSPGVRAVPVHGLRQRVPIRSPTTASIGRPSESLYRAGGALDRTTSFAYNGLVVSQTDPLSHTTTRATSAWGNLLRVTDAANGQTNYQYDAFGLLKQATDPANNVVSQVTYNVRGMRTQLADMDLGTWNYTPNALGEVVSQTDAKSQTTTFVYDPLGRPTSRTEGEGPPPGPGVRWRTTRRPTSTSAVSSPWRVRATPNRSRYDSVSRPLTRTIVATFELQVRLRLQHAGPARHADLPDQHRRACGSRRSTATAAAI